MRQKLFAILSVLVVASLTFTAAFADTIHFRGRISFGLGSLFAEGYIDVLPDKDVKVVLVASGKPTVMCVNTDDDDDEVTQIPATNPPRVTGIGSVTLFHPFAGSSSFFHVETNNPTLTAAQAGCPSGEHWKANVTFVAWDTANITVKDAATNAKLLAQDFKCTTVIGSVDCRPKKSHGGDDDDHRKHS